MPVLSCLRTPALAASKQLMVSTRSSSRTLFRINTSTSLVPSRQTAFRKGEELTRTTNTFRHVKRYYASDQSTPKTGLKQQPRRNNKRLIMASLVTVGLGGGFLLYTYGPQAYVTWTVNRKIRSEDVQKVNSPLYGENCYLFHYKGYVVPVTTILVTDDIPPFQVREDDVFIMSFPKSGTTWMQEIVYLIENGVDFEKVKSNLEYRFPYFEFYYPGISKIAKRPSPRFIKTHLPFSLLPDNFLEKKPKTIYVARNPKDVVVSLHHMTQKFIVVETDISLDDYCQLFLDGHVPFGKWWRHVAEAWERRNDDNVLFFTYEEMKKDLPDSIRKIAAFLGKSLTQEQVDAIASHCSFNKMKENKYVNFTWYKDQGLADKKASFHRKGTVGDWRNHMSKAMVTKMDEMVKTKLEPKGLKLTDSLDE